MRPIYRFIFVLVSCSSAQNVTINTMTLSNGDIAEVAKVEYGFTDEDALFRSDQVKFNELLNSLSSEELKNDLSQPLQFRYYDSTRALKVLCANCDVPYKRKKGVYIWY